VQVKSSLVSISIAVIAINLLLVNSNINFGPNDWKGALESDAKGYYAYLPAIFIHQDLNFSFLEENEAKYAQHHIYWDYRSTVNGVAINKCFIGVSVLQAPFFLIAHAISYIDHQDLDGYSKWYMLFISISSIFYHLVGLYFFSKLLQFFKVRPEVIALLLFSISFGTNLYVYTLVEAGMSHSYSFCLVSVFIWACYRAFVLKQDNQFWKCSLLVGLIVISRPVNAMIVLFIPFLFSAFSEFVLRLKDIFTNWKSIMQLILPFVLMISIQLIYYKLATGKFFVYSYNEEGFIFSNPEWINFLFSYKKGLFLYTPIYLVATLSLFFNKSLPIVRKLLWFLAMGTVIYVFSSWWMWFFGGGFSGRVIVDYIPLFMLPLGLFLNQVKPKRGVIISSVIVLLIVVCQIQSYQYRYYEIHYSEMTKEKYWDVFLLRNRF
tara:strand:+ start:22831 stop:24132 length:1302 start_codon:yes stop_codon:yes gene_type:complete